MKLIIPMGKTGTGKDTIARFILDRSFILPIISYTTRPIRNGEVDGREHWFITDEEMNHIQNETGICIEAMGKVIESEINKL